MATNYSQAREQQVRSGDLARALLASIAIPGALPPVVHDGDLLCDGGTFNNFPVDVMRDMRGVGTVIGVDLGARNPRRLEFDEVPGSVGAAARSIAAAQQATLSRAVADGVPAERHDPVQHLAPATAARADRRCTSVRRCNRVGLLQWSRFDQIVTARTRPRDRGARRAE